MSRSIIVEGGRHTLGYATVRTSIPLGKHRPGHDPGQAHPVIHRHTGGEAKILTLTCSEKTTVGGDHGIHRESLADSRPSPRDPDICLTARIRTGKKSRAWGCAPRTKVYRIVAKTWQGKCMLRCMAGGSLKERLPAMFRQQAKRSGCSSAEPYPLACYGPLSADRGQDQARFFSSRSSMARYSWTRPRLHANV